MRTNWVRGSTADCGISLVILSFPCLRRKLVPPRASSFRDEPSAKFSFFEFEALTLITHLMHVAIYKVLP